MADRKLENWLHGYLSWTLPRSEAPESMILWAGLFAVASALKRKVCFPKQLMGSYEIYPNLYVIFVAPPGVSRKSTTAGYAEELLLNITLALKKESINIAPTSSSVSKLIETLSQTDDSSLTIISSEFSSFIGASQGAMYEFLTDIFDGKRKFEYTTRSHGTELSDKPIINLLAATTPAWVSRQPPEYFLGGGFASRVIFVFESKRRQSKLYYDNVDYRTINELTLKLTHDLAVIAQLNGTFKHETTTLRDEMEAWYHAHVKMGVEDTRLGGYHERKHLHIHKVAMILSACTRDDLIITKEHFEQSKLLLQDVEEKMPRALSQVGSNPIGQFLYEIRDFIVEKGEVNKKKIFARFHRDLSTDQIGQLIADLKFVDDIEISQNNGTDNPTYRVKKKAT